MDQQRIREYLEDNLTCYLRLKVDTPDSMKTNAEKERLPEKMQEYEKLQTDTDAAAQAAEADGKLPHVDLQDVGQVRMGLCQRRVWQLFRCIRFAPHRLQSPF